MKEKSNFLSLFIWIIYFFVNGFFIVKYASEKTSILNVALIVAFYFFCVLSVVFIVDKLKITEKFYQFLFFLIVASFFCITIFVNYKVDGNTLNVDRWSALENSINALLSGKYPYTITSHMHHASSNMPMLIYLAIPFYKIFGSVGYIQSFSFLLFSGVIFSFFKNYKQRILALFLLLLSLSYLWEIYTKSDLYSNFILLISIIYFIDKKIKNNQIKPYSIAILLTLVSLTRIPVVFPLIIFYFNPFLKLENKQKIVFILTTLVTLVLALLPFIIIVPNFQILLENNPLSVQNQQPLWISIIILAVTIFFAFKTKNIEDIYQKSAVVLFLSVFIVFILRICETGYSYLIGKSYFDISHFNMCMPFVILSMVINNFKLKENKLMN